MEILMVFVLFIGIVLTYSYGKIYLSYRDEVKKITENDSLETAERIKNKKRLQISAIAPSVIVIPLFLIKVSGGTSQDTNLFLILTLVVIFISTSSFLQSLTSKIYIKNNNELIFPGRQSSFKKENIEKFKQVNKTLVSIKTKDSKEHMLYSSTIDGMILVKKFLGIKDEN